MNLEFFCLLVEWCRKETFSPVVGEFVLTDLRTAEYTIPDLNKVHVCAQLFM